MHETFIGSAGTNKNKEKNDALNAHKSCHALKFQIIASPDSVARQSAGPLEGGRHDWALYVRS